MFEFSCARTEKTLTALKQLAFDVYARSGYVGASATPQDGIRAYLGKPGVYTVVAHVGSRIVGTISLVHAKENTLPMEALYAEELMPLLTDRTCVGEVTQFVVDDTSFTETSLATETKLEVSIGLLAHVIALATYHGITTCCFTINPKHRAFYESFGCLQIGGEKMYTAVEGAPALAYCLNLERVKGVPESGTQNFLAQKIRHFSVREDFYTSSM